MMRASCVLADQARSRKVEQAIESDRRFFKRRPERTHRVRIACSSEVEELGGARLPSHLRWFVIARQLSPGARLRLLFPCFRDANTDVNEAQCAAIFATMRDERCDAIETAVREVQP